MNTNQIVSWNPEESVSSFSGPAQTEAIRLLETLQRRDLGNLYFLTVGETLRIYKKDPYDSGSDENICSINDGYVSWFFRPECD